VEGGREEVLLLILKDSIIHMLKSWVICRITWWIIGTKERGDGR
jgi:hypothetical protein